MKSKLCCLLNGEEWGLGAVRDPLVPCTCGFRVCSRCANEASKKIILSKLWQTKLYLIHMDTHYYTDPDCPWIKAFIRQEGEPNLNG